MARKRPFRNKPRRPFFRAAKRGLTLACLLFLTALGGILLQGKVIKVHDGDTISIMTSAGRIEKIRLYGIDAPEMDQTGGSQSKNFTKSSALLKEVSLQTIYTDPYGRKVAIVRFEDDTTLNQILVQNGHAWVYSRYCDIPQCIQWKIDETKARQTQKGLWTEKRPIPPWRWRDNQRR